MELRELLYYLRQYRRYNQAGMVPDVSCDICDEPYYPWVDGDNVYLWCWADDVFVDPGYGVLMEMAERVEKIEE